MTIIKIRERYQERNRNSLVSKVIKKRKRRNKDDKRICELRDTLNGNYWNRSASSHHNYGDKKQIDNQLTITTTRQLKIGDLCEIIFGKYKGKYVYLIDPHNDDNYNTYWYVEDYGTGKLLDKESPILSILLKRIL